MPLNSTILANTLVAAYTTTTTTTTIDPQTGFQLEQILVVSPERASMETLASNIINHFMLFGQVAPGILVTTPVGPGATSAPGFIT